MAQENKTQYALQPTVYRRCTFNMPPLFRRYTKAGTPQLAWMIIMHLSYLLGAWIVKERLAMFSSAIYSSNGEHDPSVDRRTVFSIAQIL